MAEYRKGSHSVYDIMYHFVWVTKYRYPVLRGEVKERARELIRQICMARDINIIEGSVGKDHVHLLLSCPPKLAPSQIIQYIKGKSSRQLQMEFSNLRRRYWGQHFWARGYFCATVGSVNKDTIIKYIEDQQEEYDDNFRLE
jgi:putative transposase